MTDRTITWLPMPEHHDYGAAEDYLRLVLDPGDADRAAHELREAKHTRTWTAKDILRAAQLEPLPTDNEGVVSASYIEDEDTGVPAVEASLREH